MGTPFQYGHFWTTGALPKEYQALGYFVVVSNAGACRCACSVEGSKCKFWPICKKSNEVCGGKTKELCLVYGQNGTRMQMPSVEKLEYQYQLETWWDNKKH
jgi:hypothetical protein